MSSRLLNPARWRKRLLLALASMPLVAGADTASAGNATPTLRSVYADHFLIGAALNSDMVNGRNPRAAEIAARQFATLTAENDMKWQPIDGVGEQGHYQIGFPSIDEIELTIKDFAALGLKVMITELDVDVLPSRGSAGVADIARREEFEAALNPYVNGLPPAEQERLAQRYSDLFKLFLKHREHISRVTLWGLDDGNSWLNGFPIRGRTNHALLIDRDLKPKPAFFSVLEAGLPKEIHLQRSR